MKRQNKVRKCQGEIVSVSEIFEKKTNSVKNYGIVLKYRTRRDVVNMYKEYRATTRNGTVESGGSVLLVHVDYISSCSILKYDSVVLHGVSFLLEDLRNRNDLSLTFSNLVLSLH